MLNAMKISQSAPVGGWQPETVSMKVYLRNRKTGQYYTRPDGWCRDSVVAHDFRTVESAMKLGRSHKLIGVDVVLHYDHPACELVLPLRPGRDAAD